MQHHIVCFFGTWTQFYSVVFMVFVCAMCIVHKVYETEYSNTINWTKERQKKRPAKKKIILQWHYEYKINESIICDTAVWCSQLNYSVPWFSYWWINEFFIPYNDCERCLFHEFTISNVQFLIIFILCSIFNYIYSWSCCHENLIPCDFVVCFLMTTIHLQSNIFLFFAYCRQSIHNYKNHFIL